MDDRFDTSDHLDVPADLEWLDVRTQVKRGDYAFALASCDRLLAQPAAHADAAQRLAVHEHRMQCWIATGELDRAVADADAILAALAAARATGAATRSPLECRTLAVRAELLLDTDRPAVALRDADELVAIDPGLFAYHALRADVLRRLGRVAEAAAADLAARACVAAARAALRDPQLAQFVGDDPMPRVRMWPYLGGKRLAPPATELRAPRAN
jgi:tetratricopeptide (TPR) repeat protein